MRINGFRCDGCGKEHLVDPTIMADSMYTKSVLPENWYMVNQGSLKPGVEPWLFCSKECLRYHPLKRTEEER